MKKLFLLSILNMFAFSLLAQTDIIYTVNNGAIIFDCKIIEVKDGNIVYYTKDSISNFVRALAINKNGINIELKKYINHSVPKKTEEYSENMAVHKGHDYDYYEKKYKRAKNLRTFGTITTCAGLTATMLGVVFLSIGDDENGAGWSDTGRGWSIAGAAITTIGAPLWIIGGIRSSTNKAAMQKVKPQAELSFGYTSNGLGLIYCF